MSYCRVHIILAYTALIYILASIFYLIQTRSYGTPFKDAVKKYPSLVKIKTISVEKRRRAFYNGLIISIALAFIFRPLRSTC